MNRLLFSIICVLFLNTSLSAQNVQWACKLVSTNDPTTYDWYVPSDAIGVPNVYPNSKNGGHAWIVGYNHNGIDYEAKGAIYITVEFCNPVFTQQVVVAETHAPGSIAKIYLIDEKGKEKLVYDETPREVPESVRMLSVPVKQTKRRIKQVKLVCYPSKVKGWNCIDAIGISPSRIPVTEEIKINESNANSSLLSPPKFLDDKINSKYKDKEPQISPDGKTLYFSRVADPNNIDGEKDDIWYSTKDENGEWTKAVNIGKPLNNSGYNFVTSVTPDGNTLLLGNTYNADGSPKGGGASMTNRIKGGWAVPRNLNIKEFKNKNRFAGFHLSSNGKVILMSIEDDNSLGDADIYVSFLQSDGSWSKPKNLGKGINTVNAEYNPYMAADGITLYFASNGYYGYGGCDIYMSKRLDNTWENWTQPINMGPVLNSKENEFSFNITADGKYAYGYKYHNETMNEDIYVVDFSTQSSKVKPEPVVMVIGKVYDAKTKLPIEANISYQTLDDGVEVGIAHSNPNTGDYKIILPPGKDYGFYADAPGYIAVHENLEVADNKEYLEIQRDLYLVPIEIGQSIKMNNVFFVQSKPELLPSSYLELDQIVQIMKNNPTMEIELHGHTDNVGDPKKNYDLSMERVKTVKAYFESKGISGKRIELKAFGGTKPIASNAKEETRKLNRRVEFIIIKK
ncbi:MAG TPA: OmpA family protein [Cytophagaceae bacterium]